ARIWHGYTTRENAVEYENLLKTEIFEGIANKRMKGYKSIQLLKRELENEFEFITIMWFDKIDDVKQFMGEDHETAYVLPQAQKLLKRYDAKSVHYDLLHELKYE
ncbi:MAG TPA: antibiotic biosynthesis monooxygenase, partial [Chitinophagaceae bacterium]